MHPSNDRLLRLIALFKFFKAATLIALSLGAFKFVHKDLGGTMEHWAQAMRLDPGNRYVDEALTRVWRLRPAQIQELALGSLLYAALFLSEGTGLWLRKPWGEWLTVIITGTLIPVEIYEIYRHLTAVRVGVLVVNIGIVLYLIYHIRSRRAAR